MPDGEHGVRYPGYEDQVNRILDVARAARQLENTFPGTPAADLIQHLEEPAQNWWWSLIDIIMDYEDASVIDVQR